MIPAFLLVDWTMQEKRERDWLSLRGQNARLVGVSFKVRIGGELEGTKE